MEASEKQRIASVICCNGCTVVVVKLSYAEIEQIDQKMRCGSKREMLLPRSHNCAEGVRLLSRGKPRAPGSTPPYRGHKQAHSLSLLLGPRGPRGICRRRRLRVCVVGLGGVRDLARLDQSSLGLEQRRGWCMRVDVSRTSPWEVAWHGHGAATTMRAGERQSCATCRLPTPRC